MKVELLVSRSGVDGAQNIGDVVEVSNKEAKRMIEVGQAKPVRVSGKIENAAKKIRSEKASK